MLSPAQLERNRKGGRATFQKHGRQHYVDMGLKGGPLGGRPTFEAALKRADLLARKARAENRPGRPRSKNKEMLLRA